MGAKTLMSVEEFERLPDDDLRHELDEGELITMPPPAFKHGKVAGKTTYRLLRYLEEHPLGTVCVDGGFLLGPHTVRPPDVAFVRKDRPAPEEGFFPGAPDLAVEVFSPSESTPQLMRKVQQYLRAGTHTVWVLYPETRQVHVFEKDRDRILNAEDTLDAPELLPGFSVGVQELFE